MKKHSKEKTKEASKPEKLAKVKKTSTSRKNLDIQEKLARDFRKRAFSGSGVALGVLGMKPDLPEEAAEESMTSPPPLDEREEQVSESRKDSPERDQIKREEADDLPHNPQDQQGEIPQTALVKQEGSPFELKRPVVPDRESWQYAGRDSTAVVDITILEVEDGGEEIGAP